MVQHSSATVGGGAPTDGIAYTYDDWGNVTSFEQDRDGAVGGGGASAYAVGYTWAKATPSGSHDTLRCTNMTLPGTGDTSSITYVYDSTSNCLDDVTSRVTKVQTGGGPTTRATYKYLGATHLVGTDLVEPDVYSRMYGSSAASYDSSGGGGMDRFNRTKVSRWTKNISPAKNFHQVTLVYDRNSNITESADAVHPGFDVLYAMDGRNRLTQSDEGTLVASAITSNTRGEVWTLSQPGNWSNHKLDLTGDGVYTAGGELNDTGTFNTVNELTARDIDTAGGSDYTLTYNDLGQLTDDGEDFKYVYDAFGRLTCVKNRSNNAVIAEYRYNGLNHRITWKYDTDTDGDVDGNDKTFKFAYDARWRMVATLQDSDTNPKERFAWHQAGLNGRGGSSYIDSVVLRDRDMTNGWTGNSDGTLEVRHYYCQNWRADVSAVLKYEDSVWRVAEWVKYSPYGVPFAITPADYDITGFIDTDDDTDFDTAYNGGAGAWSARVDLDLDGTLTSNDEDIFDAEFIGGEAGGRFVLSRDSVASRVGYAGYQYDPTFVGSERSLYHVRHRVYDAGIGAWLRRDPLRQGNNLYTYVILNPIVRTDFSGLIPSVCNGAGCGSGTGSGASKAPPQPKPGPGMTVEQCNAAIDWCMEKDQVTQNLLAHLMICDETNTSDTFELPSISCEGGGNAGGYNCYANTIRISPGTALGPADVCLSLRHELSHALDDCWGNTECLTNTTPDEDDCYQNLCSEARAYHRSGECCKWRLGGFSSYCACIAYGAMSSTDKWWSGACKPYIEGHIDDVIYGGGCLQRSDSQCKSDFDACILPR